MKTSETDPKIHKFEDFRPYLLFTTLRFFVNIYATEKFFLIIFSRSQIFYS